MLLLLWSLAAQALPPYAQADAPSLVVEADPFAWVTPTQVVHTAGDSRVALRLTVPEGYVVYKDQLEVTVSDPGPLTFGPPDWPVAVDKPDPFDPGTTRAQYQTDVVVYLPVQAPEHFSGGVVVQVQTRHQGCRPGLCFPPVTETRSLLVAVRSGDDSAGAE